MVGREIVVGEKVSTKERGFYIRDGESMFKNSGSKMNVYGDISITVYLRAIRSSKLLAVRTFETPGVRWRSEADEGPAIDEPCALVYAVLDV